MPQISQAELLRVINSPGSTHWLLYTHSNNIFSTCSIPFSRALLSEHIYGGLEPCIFAILVISSLALHDWSKSTPPQRWKGTAESAEHYWESGPNSAALLYAKLETSIVHSSSTKHRFNWSKTFRSEASTICCTDTEWFVSQLARPYVKT